MPRAGSFLLLLPLLVGATGIAVAEECVTTAESPNEIDPEEADRLYDCIEAKIVAAYGKVEGIPGVPEYRDWTVVSTVPFISRTHGRMFINHIVSPEAEPLYRQWEGMRGQALPAGSILAKESFLVDANGQARPGPLFLMEKAPASEASNTDGWIYTQIFVDGRFERTGGPGSRRMQFCHDCHGAVMDQDAMFFPPPAYRVDPPD